MKVSHVSAFGRAARILALAAVTLGLGAAPLLAQGTGKIEGRVRDQAGAPIVNAQMIIVGTAFNAETNPQGYYFINNVPAGTISVRAAFIGYKSTQVDGVRVLGGQTGTVDIQLEQTPVEIQEITVVTQTQPLVPRDEVTSKQRIDGVFTDNLPVDRLNACSRSSRASWPARPATPSRSAAAAPMRAPPTWTGYRCHRASGASASPPRRAPRSRVGTNALEEASVTTGLVLGGIRQRAVRHHRGADPRGRLEYTGNFGYETDEPFGVKNGYGFNRFQGSVGGPLWQNLSFFVSGALEGQASVADRVRRGTVADVRPGRGGHRGRGAVRRRAIPPPTPPWFPSSTTPRTGVTAMTFAGSANPDIANNYGRGLPGHPHAVLGADHLQPPGQAQLHLRHRLPDLADRHSAASSRAAPSCRTARSSGRF